MEAVNASSQTRIAQVPSCGLRAGQLLWSFISKTGLASPPPLFLPKKCTCVQINRCDCSLTEDRVSCALREDGDDYEHGNSKSESQ